MKNLISVVPSPTDHSTIAGASPALGVVLEGESLLNDGTAIILFNIFLALSIPSDSFSGKYGRNFYLN